MISLSLDKLTGGINAGGMFEGVFIEMILLFASAQKHKNTKSNQHLFDQAIDVNACGVEKAYSVVFVGA